MPDEFWSTLTAPLYPLAFTWAVMLDATPEAYVLWGCLFLLAFGTAAHHWTGLEDVAGQDLDHAGMNATYLALAVFAVGASWPWLLIAAVVGAAVVELWLDMPNKSMMGSTVLVATIGGVAQGEPILAGSGFLAMLGGFYFQPQGDVAHGLGWHLLTSVGTTLIYLGLA